MHKRLFIFLLALSSSAVVGQEISYPQIRLIFPDEVPTQFRMHMHQWAQDSARALDEYYVGFPIISVDVCVQIRNGRGVHGRAFGFQRGKIKLQVGKDIPFPDFSRYWVMPHEFIHLAMPNIGERHSWLMEGISTYVEPIARYKIGQLTRQQVIEEWWENFPKGLPRSGKGLNQDKTWGARYWGGALFCFLADIRLRQESNGKYGFERALRAVARSKNKSTTWSINQWLKVVSQATASDTIKQLYQEMALAPIEIDLNRLWGELGVVKKAGRLSIDDRNAHKLNSLFRRKN